MRILLIRHADQSSKACNADVKIACSEMEICFSDSK